MPRYIQEPAKRPEKKKEERKTPLSQPGKVDTKTLESSKKVMTYTSGKV